MAIVPMLLGGLVAVGVLLVVRWASARKHAAAADGGSTPTLPQLLIGFVTNFFDTLGIGSFATTTAAFRLLRMVPDELIPGTLLVGHALPVVTQALFFISVVNVDPWQMTILIVAMVAGAWLGVGVVASLSRRGVQLGMGSGLLAAALFMLVGMYGLFPAGGTASVFTPGALVVATVVNFFLGAIATLGIGSYAPTLIMFSLLGMDPRAAFPIMAGSAGFVATIAGVRFIAKGRYHSRAALGLTLGGVPGVIIAAWLVQSLPLGALRWLVLIVVAYASLTLLTAGLRGGASGSRSTSAPH